MASISRLSLRAPLSFSKTINLQVLSYRRITTAGHHQPQLEQPLTSQTTEPESRPKSSSSPPPPTSLIQEVEPKSAASLPFLPYHVHRTASQELPIYHLAKRGGNLHQTRIRKIEGDIARLRDDLQATLKLKREHAVINQVTGHIILKGWYKDQVKSFLQARHF